MKYSREILLAGTKADKVQKEPIKTSPSISNASERIWLKQNIHQEVWTQKRKKHYVTELFSRLRKIKSCKHLSKKLPKTLKNWKQGNKEHGNQTAGLCLLMRVSPSRWHTLSSRTCFDTNKHDAIILFNLRSGLLLGSIQFCARNILQVEVVIPTISCKKGIIFYLLPFLDIEETFSSHPPVIPGYILTSSAVSFSYCSNTDETIL